MTEFTLTDNGETPPFRVEKGASSHLSLDGSFASGTFALQKLRNKQWFPVYDYDHATNVSTAIVYTQPLDTELKFKGLEVFKLVLTGATGPNVVVGVYSDGGDDAG